MIGRLRRRAAHALDRRFAAVAQRLADDGAAREAAVLAALARSDEAAARRDAALGRRLDELSPLLRAVVDDESANRRRVWALREDPGYALAFTEAEPLVTITVPTRERVELLMDRSLASILGQTYERLDVIVVGDDATPEVAAAVSGLPDPRVRFVNLTTRVLATDGNPWLAAATMPRNEGYRLARGRWTIDFDDDDALRPDAVATLLEHARATRAEVAYGDAEQHAPDGATTVLGSFPPRLGDFSLAASLVHAGLRVFTREHVATALGIPGDWYRVQRMLRAGVRFAHRPGVVHDYYPSTLWRPGAGTGPG